MVDTLDRNYHALRLLSGYNLMIYNGDISPLDALGEVAEKRNEAREKNDGWYEVYRAVFRWLYSHYRTPAKLEELNFENPKGENV